ncbi:MAG: transposase [Gaiellaceae bacterium]
MARTPRSSLPDGFFHVTARAVHGARLFLDDEDFRSFLRLLTQTVDRHGWRVHAFCLMNTHYHLIVEATQPSLSAGQHRLNGHHARRFNKRHVRRGHLFAERFSSWVIEGEDYLSAACLYVLHNPVRAGLCRYPDDWRWSGARGDGEGPGGLPRTAPYVSS